MDYSTHRYYRKRPIIMAIMMIVVGLLTIQYRYDNVVSYTDRSFVRFLSGFILVGFGAAILIPRYREIMPSVGLMCLGIGLSRMVVGLSYIKQHDDMFAMFPELDYLVWFFGYVTFAFSLYMIYRGVNFMRMDSMNAFIMRFTTMGIIIAYTLILIYADQVVGFKVSTVWDYRRDLVTTPFLYLIYFALLCSKEVFDQMWTEKLRKSIAHVPEIMNPGILTTSPQNYSKFKDRYPQVSSWDTITTESPIERQLSLELRSEGPTLRLLLEKWKDSDRTTYTIIPADDGPFIAAQRGVLGNIIFDPQGLSVYNRNELATRILVEEQTAEVEEEIDEELIGGESK